jgi:hypothetical protein
VHHGNRPSVFRAAPVYVLLLGGNSFVQLLLFVLGGVYFKYAEAVVGMVQSAFVRFDGFEVDLLPQQVRELFLLFVLIEPRVQIHYFRLGHVLF